MKSSSKHLFAGKESPKHPENPFRRIPFCIYVYFRIIINKAFVEF